MLPIQRRWHHRVPPAFHGRTFSPSFSHRRVRLTLGLQRKAALERYRSGWPCAPGNARSRGFRVRKRSRPRTGCQQRRPRVQVTLIQVTPIIATKPLIQASVITTDYLWQHYPLTGIHRLSIHQPYFVYRTVRYSTVLSLFYINPAVFCTVHYAAAAESCEGLLRLRLPLSVAHWADH
jgi:hypothetical protein